MKALLVATILIGTFGSLAGQDANPFGGDVSSEPEQGPTKLKFRSGSELEINDDRLAKIDLKEIHFDLNLSGLAKPESEGIGDQRAVRFFDRPKAMWRLDDGFLAAYDAGEFGGLFSTFPGMGRPGNSWLPNTSVIWFRYPSRSISPLAVWSTWIQPQGLW